MARKAQLAHKALRGRWDHRAFKVSKVKVNKVSLELKARKAHKGFKVSTALKGCAA